VVLAAGGSRRLGTPKQLLRRRIRPLLVSAVEAVHAATGGPVIVVVGAHALRLRGVLRRTGAPSIVVHNSGWSTGLAGSLQAGLSALPAAAQAALICLSDQPNVDTAALCRLIAAWRRRPRALAAARYAGRVGVPAILPRRTWRSIAALRGDEGARALLRGQSNLTIVEIPEAAFDVDTPADAARLR
jgi:CTP:molybdopterin cytidylyltransferase MocA